MKLVPQHVTGFVALSRLEEGRQSDRCAAKGRGVCHIAQLGRRQRAAALTCVSTTVPGLCALSFSVSLPARESTNEASIVRNLVKEAAARRVTQGGPTVTARVLLESECGQLLVI